MTTYRTGNHHGITICADGQTCDRPGHDCALSNAYAVLRWLDQRGGA